MHEKLEALKPLLKAGEYEKAAEALKTYREEFPDDWDGKLMEGLIAQLRGDEKTFRRIHDEAQDFIRKAAAIQSSSLWEKYRRLIQKDNGDNEMTEIPVEKEESTDNTNEEDTFVDDETTDINQYPHRVLYGSPEYMDSRIEKKQRQKVQYSSLSFRKSVSSNEELDEPTQVPEEPYEGDLYAGPEYMDSLIEAKKIKTSSRTIGPSETRHDSDKTVISKEKDDEKTVPFVVYEPNNKDKHPIACGSGVPLDIDDTVWPEDNKNGKEESSDQPGPLYRACQYLARFLWKLSGKFQS